MHQNILMREPASARETTGAARAVRVADGMEYKTTWTVEKWDDEQIDWARKRLVAAGITIVQNGVSTVTFESERSKLASEILGREVQDMVVEPNLIDIRDQPVPSALLRQLLIPDEIVEEHGNLMLNAGIQKFGELLGGISTPTKWDNANAQIGVGDSTTAESASQTDLQAATNHTWVGMNATYPSRSSQTFSWQADHTASNFAWQEVAIRNGASAANLLNRKVTSLGTKTTGTWTLTVTITWS